MSYSPTGSYPTGLTSPTDKRIGDAFPIIEEVYKHLPHLKYLAENANSLVAKQIELRGNTSLQSIEWAYQDTDEWFTLIAFTDLTGGIAIDDLINNLSQLLNDAKTYINDQIKQSQALANQTQIWAQYAVDNINRIGYDVPVAYVAGLVVDHHTFTVDYNGILYSALPSKIPFTTGAWDPSKWTLVQNTANTNQIYQFPTLGVAESAALTLPTGSAVVVDGVSQGHVTGGAYIAEAGVPAIVFQDYAAMTAYTGKSSVFQVKNPRTGGVFSVVEGDTITPGDGGTIFVLADGRRVKRLFTSGASPLWFGAFGNGSGDDTSGIQKAINSCPYIDMSGINWMVTGKITVPSNRFIDLRGSNLNANNGSDPIFEFETAGDGLYILHGAGVITGTAGSFLKCSGTTNTPTSVVQYARQIRLEGLHISSESIENFLDFQGAVRQVFMHKIQACTKNGINANGKCVEVNGHACVIYGSTNSLTTYGVKLRGPGGGSAYPEGFHFTDCTIDAFGNTFDVTDIYVMSVTAGHVGCVRGGRVALFGYPTTTACRDIKFTGVNISGPIEFLPTGGLAYQAQFTGCVSENCDWSNFTINNNAASIDISDHKFHRATRGIAVICYDNNADINVRNITCDSTFISGVLVLGSAGANCSIRGVSYAGTGDSVYLERPVLVSGVPVNSPTVLSYLQTFNAKSIQGAYAINAEIASIYTWFPRGETGEIIGEISFNGASASGQILEIVLPAGLEVASGSGWNSKYIQPNASSGRISVRIPYRATSEIVNKPIALKNSAGNTLNIDYHSFFGIRRNW